MKKKKLSFVGRLLNVFKSKNDEPAPQETVYPEPQLISLSILGPGKEFWFGCIRFEYISRRGDLILCKMERGDNYVYISSSALVSLDL